MQSSFTDGRRWPGDSMRRLWLEKSRMQTTTQDWLTLFGVYLFVNSTAGCYAFGN